MNDREKAAMRQYLEPTVIDVMDPLADDDQFTTWDKAKREFCITNPVILDLSRVPLNVRLLACSEPGSHPRWWTEPETCRVKVIRGYRWNGVSCGFTTPDQVISSLAHDIVCTEVEVEGKRVPAMRGYRARHLLFYYISRSQGVSWLRASIDYLGLMLFNRAYSRISWWRQQR